MTDSLTWLVCVLGRERETEGLRKRARRLIALIHRFKDRSIDWTSKYIESNYLIFSRSLLHSFNEPQQQQLERREKERDDGRHHHRKVIDLSNRIKAILVEKVCKQAKKRRISKWFNHNYFFNLEWLARRDRDAMDNRDLPFNRRCCCCCGDGWLSLRILSKRTWKINQKSPPLHHRINLLEFKLIRVIFTCIRRCVQRHWSLRWLRRYF